MSRPLSDKEAAVITAIIENGTSLDRNPTDAERQEFLTRARLLEVTGGCDCGRCESIKLGIDGAAIEYNENRYVLNASTESVMLILFVDDGTPSELEVVSYDEGYAGLPEASELTFPQFEAVEEDK